MIYPPMVLDRMRQLGKTMSIAWENQAVLQYSYMSTSILEINPQSIMDIGRGLAIIDILIARFAPIREIHLVDGDGMGRKLSGFKSDMQAWNDVNLGVQTVRANVPPDVRVVGYYADDPAINMGVDLIISCRSWGHHYPISTHAAMVRRCLNPGGHVITDVRNGTTGLKDLAAIGLCVVRQIEDPSLKCTRWLLKDAR